MTDDLISVVIPCYNTSFYLDKCLETVVNQSYKILDVILVNDGSTDDTGDKCDAWAKKDNRIRVIHQINGGLSDARNTGISNAKGKYITFIDSDDYIDENMIQYLYQLIIKYNTNMSLCTHTVILESGKHMINGNGGDEVLSDKDAVTRMLYHDVIDTSAWAKLYDISLFKDICYPKGMLFEDIGTTYKLFIASKKIACGYKDHYFYVKRKNSIVTSSFSQKKLNLLTMTDKMGEDVSEIYPDLEDAVIRRRVYARFSTLNQIPNNSLYSDIVDSLISFIMMYRCSILFNRKVPIRDKIAIIALMFGKNVYSYLWNYYEQHLKGEG